jgi:hypothetical protein
MTPRGRHPLVAAGVVAAVFAACAPTPSARLAAALREPLVFRWTEILQVGMEPNHVGGVAFVERQGKVYSVAWVDPASGRKWPPVFGVGRREGRWLVVEYRTLVPDPTHFFYRAECRFEIADDLGGFDCQFRQRIHPDATELQPGAASGDRGPVVNAEAHLAALAYRVQELEAEAASHRRAAD